MKKEFLATMIPCLFFAGCSSANTTQIQREQIPLSLITASDIHYFSKSLFPNEERFLEALALGDGKTAHYTDEIMDAFIDQVKEENVDAVIFTGDLTLYGEYQSHVDFAQKLEKIEANGTPVLVIPGNHDLNSTRAISYTDTGYETVKNISNEEFVQLYGNFGYNEALSKDSSSLSYTYLLNDSTIALMIDVNGCKDYMTLSQKTLQWVEKQLRKAQREDRTVLAFSHQNFLNHAEIFPSGYQINNADQILDLFHQYHVQVGFSGHLHIQDILEDGSFTEMTTSALSIIENHYGKITVDANQIQYQTDSLDIAKWAKEHNSKDEDLLHYDTCASQFFDTAMSKDMRKDEEELSNYIKEINRAYFTGHVDEIEENETYNTILKERSDLMSLYIVDYVLQNKDNKNTFIQKRED